MQIASLDDKITSEDRKWRCPFKQMSVVVKSMVPREEKFFPKPDEIVWAENISVLKC